MFLSTRFREGWSDNRLRLGWTCRWVVSISCPGVSYNVQCTLTMSTRTRDIYRRKRNASWDIDWWGASLRNSQKFWNAQNLLLDLREWRAIRRWTVTSEKHRERRRVMVAVFDETMARKICQDKCLCTVNGMKPMWRVKQTNLHLLSLLSRSQTINSDALLTVRCIKRKKKAMVLVATEQIQHIVSTCSALISCFVTWFHGIARLHTILALTFAAPLHASCLLCVRVAFPVRRVATSVELGPPTESVSVPNWLVGFNRSNDGRWFSWRLWKRRGYC